MTLDKFSRFSLNIWLPKMESIIYVSEFTFEDQLDGDLAEILLENHL